MLQSNMNKLAFNFEEQKSKITRLKKYTSQMSILFVEDYTTPEISNNIF